MKIATTPIPIETRVRKDLILLSKSEPMAKYTGSKIFIYSLLKASTGSRPAAFIAGINPAITPTKIDIELAKII